MDGRTSEMERFVGRMSKRTNKWMNDVHVSMEYRSLDQEIHIFLWVWGSPCSNYDRVSIVYMLWCEERNLGPDCFCRTDGMECSATGAACNRWLCVFPEKTVNFSFHPGLWSWPWFTLTKIKVDWPYCKVWYWPYCKAPLAMHVSGVDKCLNWIEMKIRFLYFIFIFMNVCLFDEGFFTVEWRGFLTEFVFLLTSIDWNFSEFTLTLSFVG